MPKRRRTMFCPLKVPRIVFDAVAERYVPQGQEFCECSKADCAWWHEGEGECAVLAIANLLDAVACNLAFKETIALWKGGD